MVEFSFGYSVTTILYSHSVLDRFIRRQLLFNLLLPHKFVLPASYVNCRPRRCRGTITRKDKEETTVTTKNIQKSIRSMTNAICRHSLTTLTRWSSCSWRCSMYLRVLKISSWILVAHWEPGEDPLTLEVGTGCDRRFPEAKSPLEDSLQLKSGFISFSSSWRLSTVMRNDSPWN